MIAYVTFGANDPAVSKAFYTPVLAALGYSPIMEHEEWTGYSRPDSPGLVWLGRPYDKQAATPSNGTMVGFMAMDEAQVNAAHAAALANGGTCEGEPGPRPQYGPGMYLAYVRDPVGNKMSFMYRDPALAV